MYLFGIASWTLLNFARGSSDLCGGRGRDVRSGENSGGNPGNGYPWFCALIGIEINTRAIIPSARATNRMTILFRFMMIPPHQLGCSRSQSLTIFARGD